MLHLPEITDGAYKTATEIAIETLLQEAKITIQDSRHL